MTLVNNCFLFPLLAEIPCPSFSKKHWSREVCRNLPNRKQSVDLSLLRPSLELQRVRIWWCRSACNPQPSVPEHGGCLPRGSPDSPAARTAAREWGLEWFQPVFPAPGTASERGEGTDLGSGRQGQKERQCVEVESKTKKCGSQKNVFQMTLLFKTFTEFLDHFRPLKGFWGSRCVQEFPGSEWKTQCNMVV